MHQDTEQPEYLTIIDSAVEALRSRVDNPDGLRPVYAGSRHGSEMGLVGVRLPLELIRAIDIVAEHKSTPYRTRSDVCRDAILQWVKALNEGLQDQYVAAIIAFEIQLSDITYVEERSKRSKELLTRIEQVLANHINHKEYTQARTYLISIFDSVSKIGDGKWKGQYTMMLNESAVISNTIDILKCRGVWKDEDAVGD